MDCDIIQSEESHLIKEDVEEKEERCSSCLRFPKAVYFITVTELCERFNYYGMRTILILYLTQHLLMKEGNAVSIYHLFVSFCYFTTILGSFVADNYLGKYKTLVIICIMYSLGSALMSLTSITSINLSGPLISLLLIALGTGGVKACVGPFGGDQIPSHKKVVLDSFFSMFYFAINLGALLSTILTPILRADVSCNGSDDCYPLAFGVPAMLMGVALMIFLLGRRYYIEVPVKESIYMKAFGCIIVSIKLWYRGRHTTPKKELLDYAQNEYDAAFIHDLRTLFRISILYLPLPIYWALYEQMGSRWTLQAAQMDGEIAPSLFMLPDQMSLLNVIMVMALIPVFDSCIYPICYRIEPKLKPLRRMTVGIAFTALSFFAAFILQSQIEAKEPSQISSYNSRLVLVNSYPCVVDLNTPEGQHVNVASYQTSISLDIRAGVRSVQLKFSNCKGRTVPEISNMLVNLHPGQMNFLIIDEDKRNKTIVQVINEFHSPNFKGHPMIKLAAASALFNKYQFQLRHLVSGLVEKDFLVISNESLYVSSWETVSKPGRYVLHFMDNSVVKSNTTVKWLGVLISKENSLRPEPIKLFSSEVSIFYMTFFDQKKDVIVMPLIINNGSQISILWQIPQYLLISIGEVLVSITGLSFSYNQAPEGMKSLVNALWYFSNAIGNIIVMVVAKMEIVQHQSWEYLFFGVLCIIFNIIFASLAYFYRMSKKEYEHAMEVASIDAVE